MSKWCGKIGIAEKEVELEPGYYEDSIVEYITQGDILTTNWKRQVSTERVGDDINLSNQISILADSYLLYHYSSILYVEIMGTRWKVTDVKVEHPRLILTVGGVYHGNTSGTSE